MVELNAVPSLLELLAHQNTDISVAVIDLLQELTDVDILHESIDGAEILVNALRKQQICALLVQNLDRLDESVREESEGVHNTLAIFENLTEMYPDICKESVDQGLMQWLLKRMKQKVPFEANKLYCSEILSILVQDNDENRLTLGTLDGIDVLLQQLAVYKRHDPSTTEEQEYMENLFNCMCSTLMSKENRDRFLKGEGLQLMNLMLREKKLSRNGSLKVLDHALSGPDGKENCNKFVDILGLRTIFPLFMKTPKRSKNRMLSIESHEEHVASIIASMLRNCKGAQRQRLLSKFTENDFEKVERLLELHLKYLEKVDAVDAEIDAEEDEEADDDANYLRRLSGGLFTLQLIDYIILEICSTADLVKQHVVKILNLRKASMKRIRHIMRGKFAFGISWDVFTSIFLFSRICRQLGRSGKQRMARSGATAHHSTHRSFLNSISFFLDINRNCKQFHQHTNSNKDKENHFDENFFDFSIGSLPNSPSERNEC